MRFISTHRRKAVFRICHINYPTQTVLAYIIYSQEVKSEGCRVSIWVMQNFLHDRQNFLRVMQNFLHDRKTFCMTAMQLLERAIEENRALFCFKKVLIVRYC